MSAADMSRTDPLALSDALDEARRWKIVFLMMGAIVLLLSFTLGAIVSQRDDARDRASRVEGAMRTNDEIRRFADFTTEAGQLFCIDRRDDLTVCVKNTKVTP